MQAAVELLKLHKVRRQLQWSCAASSCLMHGQWLLLLLDGALHVHLSGNLQGLPAAASNMGLLG